MVSHAAVSRAALVLLPFLLLPGCSRDGGGDAVDTQGAAASDCGDLPGPVKGITLPPGIPTPPGAVLFQAGRIGPNLGYGLRLAGKADTLGALRDSQVAALTKAGYKVGASKDGPGQVATAEFTGKQRGQLSVAPLCQGQLAVRYSVAPFAAAKPASSTAGTPSPSG